ncbi:hypothetical protein [Granulicella sp. S190]|uniref:hypothetical protein n=1 Tax=Granulicella sp. S190 TaxID=1747226 RepID=UPI00131DD543|nr:hypothetical protein [Granulicella sp. S190]
MCDKLFSMKKKRTEPLRPEQNTMPVQATAHEGDGDLFNAPQHVVDLLNGGSEQDTKFDQDLRAELRIWVDDWLRSGPNTRFMLGSLDPDRLQKLLTKNYCLLVATNGGRMLAQPFFAFESSTPDEIALATFRQFVTHSDCELLSGPCATCRKYFITKTRRAGTKYCSRKCGSDLIAKTAIGLRNKELHDELLALAKEALSQYVEERPVATSWQEWVLAHLRGKGHTRTEKSLSHWINDEKAEPGTGLKLPPEIEALQQAKSVRVTFKFANKKGEEKN